ncbi:helicase-related protein [Corallococcus sp. CA047B]|uniref:helicase-related protein n=1 Tax=Corallococcus sp. CA047B TaxID=2316729 RepID=UPI0013158F4F|nr:helicase-related protein [Corallococcus sp. CA047B]
MSTLDRDGATLVSAGELRTDVLEIFQAEPRMDLLLSAPGLLAQPPQGHAGLAREPHAGLPARVTHAHRNALLEAFGGQLDGLPQTAEWEGRIGEWIRKLSSAEARVFHYQPGPLFSRLISRPEGSLVPAGPITRGTLHRPSGAELDLALTGAVHERAREWFRLRAAESEDISKDVQALLEGSWAGAMIGAEDMYLKVLSEFFLEMLQGADLTDSNPLLEVMTTFQRAAYQQAKGILRRFGGVFLADVVGLGKTYIAMALLRYLQDTMDRHALVIAPPTVCPTWQALGEEFGVNLRVLSHGRLEDLPQYSQRQVLVVDESHNFRNPTTRRYERIWEWLHPNNVPSRRQVLLLSATPQNNSPRDVMQQMKLFPENFTRLPFPGESLEDFFKAVEAGRESLTNVLQHVVVRRTRRFIQNHYKDAKLPVKKPTGGYDWVPIRFPTRVSGPEQCLRYRIEDTYGTGLYDRIIHLLGSMEYPLYGLAAYVLEMHRDDSRMVGFRQAGQSLRGLFKVLLLKRLESSEAAFRASLERLRARLQRALENLRGGFVQVVADVEDEGESTPGGDQMPSGMFHVDRLRNALTADLERVEELWGAMHQQSPAADAKLARLRAYLATRSPRQHRTLIFTQFTDTAEFLHEHLQGEHGSVAKVTGSSGNVREIARRFAPRANPGRGRSEVPKTQQIDLLISTDVLSEGINLQDADTLINYDLHWNPVRLIQRAGRIDRLGSLNEEIHISSFLPERALETNLGLEQVLRRRIQEFLKVFGEDSHILPLEERPDVDGVLDIYAGKALEKAEAHDEMDALGRHAERILTIQQMEPARYARIRALRPGRRAATRSRLPGVVATRLGWYWAFWREQDGTGLERVADVAGLDLLFKHSEKADVTEVVHAVRCRQRANTLAEGARRLFSGVAEIVRAQRQKPALDKNEEWVLSSVDALRKGCDEARLATLDAMRQWILAGQYKPSLRLAAARWRKEQLLGEALFQQMEAMLRFPLKNEFLGEEEMVGVVVGEEPDAV